MKVLITSNSFGKYDDRPRKQMEDLGWEILDNRYGRIMNEAEMMGEVPGIDAIILGSDILSRKVLEQADRLKVISRYGVGIDNIDVNAAENRNIKVTVTKNCNTEAVADYAVGLMLSVLRHICNVNASLMAGRWQKETGLDLCHKTVAVVGLGAIGREVVKRLKGFGCRIIGYDQLIDEDYCTENGITVMEPEDIFKTADIISLHIPGNADGSYFIGGKELSLMNPATVIINTARASLIDEEALIPALSEHRIYGYGADVFNDEPNYNERFRTLTNVVLSPHNAAVTVEAVNKMTRKAVDNLFDFFKNGCEEN